MSDLMAAAQTACGEIGVIFTPVPVDGRFHPLDIDGKRKGNGAGRILIFSDGQGGQAWNHVTGEHRLFWAGSKEELTSVEREDRHRKAKIERDRAEHELSEARREAARVAMTVIRASLRAEQNAYLVRKGVMPTDTLSMIRREDLVKILRYTPKAKGHPFTGEWVLIVPARDHAGVTTIEMIDETGLKAGLFNGQKKGAFWSTAKLPDGDGIGMTIGIGEGVATMLSFYEATGFIGIAALSCTNLQSVAIYFRERFPNGRIFVVSDLGPGEEAALEAARSINALMVKPTFALGSVGNDLNDLHSECGLEAVRLCIDSAVSVVPTKEALGLCAPTRSKPQPGHDWAGEPSPIFVKSEPELCPIDILPETIRLAVQEVHDFVKAPMPLVLSAALSALSMCIQGHADVMRATRLGGPSSLFLLTVADSGERKTTCDSFFTSAIREYELKEAEAAKTELQRYDAELAAWEAKCNGVKDRIRLSAKNRESTKQQEAELLQLYDEKPERPRVPRIIYSDATPEALNYGLAKQWPSGAIVSSEAGTVFGSHGMSKGSAMRTFACWNQHWDGLEQHTDRRTSDSFIVRGSRLTMSLMVQEATLETFLKDDGGLARGTGFLARFLFSWPDSTQGFRPFTEAPANWPHLDEFNRRVMQILEQPAPIDEAGALHPVVMPLSPEAKEAWVIFYNEIESKLVCGGELYNVRDIASKVADNAARLACLFQVFTEGTGPISGDSFLAASKIAAWYLNEATRYFGQLCLPPQLADAARLDRWLIEYCRQQGTMAIPIARVQQYGPKALRQKVAIDAALDILEPLERARCVAEGKRKKILVNPRLLKPSSSDA